jgi:hypothetical protein
MTHEQVIAKFRRAVDGKLSQAQQDRIIAAVDNLDNLKRVSELMDLLN